MGAEFSSSAIVLKMVSNLRTDAVEPIYCSLHETIQRRLVCRFRANSPADQMCAPLAVVFGPVDDR